METFWGGGAVRSCDAKLLPHHSQPKSAQTASRSVARRLCNISLSPSPSSAVKNFCCSTKESCVYFPKGGGGRGGGGEGELLLSPFSQWRLSPANERTQRVVIIAVERGAASWWQRSQVCSVNLSRRTDRIARRSRKETFCHKGGIVRTRSVATTTNKMVVNSSCVDWVGRWGHRQ